MAREGPSKTVASSRFGRNAAIVDEGAIDVEGEGAADDDEKMEGELHDLVNTIESPHPPLLLFYDPLVGSLVYWHVYQI